MVRSIIIMVCFLVLAPILISYARHHSWSSRVSDQLCSGFRVRFFTNFARTLTERQGLQVGSPDEVAYQLKWITKEQLQRRAEAFGKNKYGKYLERLS